MIRQPTMGPISSGLGEIFQFEVRGEGKSLMDLRSILEWDIAFKLRSVPGVVEVNSYGGELKTLADVEFKDLDRLDIVGIYPSYAEAYKAWRAAAQRTVDNAHVRYFIVHIHRLLDPALA